VTAITASCAVAVLILAGAVPAAAGSTAGDPPASIEPTATLEPAASAEAAPSDEAPSDEAPAPRPAPAPDVPTEREDAPGAVRDEPAGDDAVGAKDGAKDDDGGEAPPVIARVAPGLNYCTEGVYTLRDNALSADTVHAVAANSSIDSGSNTGSFRDTSLATDALAITRDGTAAYAATLPSNGLVHIQRLYANADVAEYILSGGTTRSGLNNLVGGAVNATGSHYYFGGYTRTGSTTFFELFAYNIATSTYVGQVGRITMPSGASAVGNGDIVFDAANRLYVLWSPSGGGASLVANVAPANVPTTASATLTIATAGSVSIGTNGAYNGLAFDRNGILFVQRTSTFILTSTIVGRLNLATGAVTSTATQSLFAGVDLASCGQGTTLILSKSLGAGGRFFASDQFTLDIRQAGSTTNLASATTAGAATGLQPQSAGPVVVSEGAVYTVAETGAGTPTASLLNYTRTLDCLWSGGGAPFVQNQTIAYNNANGRAQATLPAIPSGRAGQSLACTITNTKVADRQPQLVLQKDVRSRIAPGHQFHLAVHRSSDQALAGEATTTGTATGVQASIAGPVTVETGVTYTISEGPSGMANLNGYAASYTCGWDGAGTPELARGVLSVGANGRMQAMLPAIPTGMQNRTLTCTIANQVTPGNGLSCEVDAVYAHHRVTGTGAGQFAKRTTAEGMSSGTNVPDRVSFGTTDNQNGLALNLDGSEAISVTQAPASGTVTMRRWAPGAGNGSVTTTTITGSGSLPSDLIGGSIDPTTGAYYFGGYAGSGSTYYFRLFVIQPGTTTYQFVREVQIPGVSGNGNGDIAFDASGNLYLVWSLSGVNKLARLNAADVVAGERISAATVADLTTSIANATFNGVAFNGRGELYVSGSFGIRRLDPSTGLDIGGIVDSSSNVVDMASCGLPPTMRLQKDIVGRNAPGNQFVLEIFATGRTSAVQAATTSGTLNGVQTAIAGPMVVTVGQTYTIRETGAGSPAADLSQYITSYACIWSDETTPAYHGVLAPPTPNSPQRQAVIGPIPSAAQLGTAKGKAGQQLVCTLTNEPLVEATVTAKKTLLDVDGENGEGASGWSLSSALVGGAGTTSGTTITTPSAKITDASGSVQTPWEIVFPSSSASAAVRMQEAQQAGYQLVAGALSGGNPVGSHCVVTPRQGAAQTVLIAAVSHDITGVRPGDRVECEFVNRPIPGSATWQKTDEHSPATRLSGSEWLLEGAGIPDDTIVVDCVAASAAGCAAGAYLDRDHRAGFFEIGDLGHGEYTLTESLAPAGYLLDDTPHPFAVTAAARDFVFSQPFVNRKLPMPALPLTGGLGSDSFLLGGGGLFALALLGILLAQRRRRRTSTA